MKNSYVIIVLLLFTSKSFARTQDTVLQRKLDTATAQMFRDSDSVFIIAHALRDRIIRNNKDCDFLYDKGTVYFNGKRLRKRLQDKYSGYMKSFLAYTGESENVWISLRLSKVTTDEITDPGSNLRKNRDIEMLRWRLRMHAADALKQK